MFKYQRPRPELAYNSNHAGISQSENFLNHLTLSFNCLEFIAEAVLGLMLPISWDLR